ncbi:dolichol-phosphate mannose synthase [Limnohabitans sp. MORI2]|uniref:glycosyltransferase family 2 protein n=1 Tax=Limnohabitans sp. MORI2 TaxID=1751150 RepID=UPI0023776ABE|nr:glycosyltransferase family 2 protein [Limnohabitans sp. MORI2]BDU57289.1 dolichol-phosphate mannose synthase [Limnohabitans sp. MORI2]
MHKFTLIIPAFNEFENLKIIFPSIKNIDCEVLIVDPGTNDGTESLCNEYGYRYLRQASKGKGNALVEAVNASKTNIVCFFDADLAHNPECIESLVDPIINGDFVHVSGSRMLGGSSELFADADHFIRLMGSMVINYLISYKFGFKMTDCQNGFRALNKEFFKSLNLNSSHTTIEQELVGKTLAKGFPILELPAHEYSRIAGESKINVLKHGPSYVLSLIKILMMSKTPIDKIFAENLKNKYSYNWWV